MMADRGDERYADDARRGRHVRRIIEERVGVSVRIVGVSCRAVDVVGEPSMQRAAYASARRQAQKALCRRDSSTLAVVEEREEVEAFSVTMVVLVNGRRAHRASGARLGPDGAYVSRVGGPACTTAQRHARRTSCRAGTSSREHGPACAGQFRTRSTVSFSRSPSSIRSGAGGEVDRVSDQSWAMPRFSAADMGLVASRSITGRFAPPRPRQGPLSNEHATHRL